MDDKELNKFKSVWDRVFPNKKYKNSLLEQGKILTPILQDSMFEVSKPKPFEDHRRKRYASNA